MRSEEETTPVDVITANCRYSGLVAHRGQRISDLLSDSRTEILEMWHTEATFVGARSADIRWKEIFLKKNSIVLVVPKGSYEAPAHRRNRYVQKHRYGAMIVLPGFVLSGIVHLPSRATPLLLLDDESTLPAFLGVTDVTVHSSTHDLGPSQCDVVVVRRQCIESVQLTAQPLAKSEDVPDVTQQEAPSSLSCAE